ncbi:uncharacterized protein LOC110106035 [Dendrobium catenatum]|uniref:uncharacterized protein LOC110106035 n=1 Tax=Dendrobium catenatum TaxID=906689 RepID=UPI0010A07F3C|nr:uncharacterized protein LOC110106035 [Dendrobium catenatum]
MILIGRNTIAEADRLEEGTRHLAGGVCDYSCGGQRVGESPGMMRRLAWAETEGMSDAGETSNYSLGQDVLIDMSIALGGNTLFQLPQELRSTVIAAPEWQNVMRSKLLLTQISEGCAKVMMKNLEQIVSMQIACVASGKMTKFFWLFHLEWEADVADSSQIKKPRRESYIAFLPPELLERILLEALATSPTPIRDIRYFKKTCKNFHAICSSKRIGKYMNVEDWRMCWQDKQGYLRFLQTYAESENTNALFLLGLEEMFNRGNYDVGLHRLQLTSNQGNITAKYLLGLWWFHDDSSRSYGINLLNEISGNIRQYRKQASKIFSKMRFQKWPSLPFFLCNDWSCMSLTMIGDYPLRPEVQEEFSFCSDVCKWKNEYEMFISMPPW